MCGQMYLPWLMHAGESKAGPQAKHIDWDTGEDSGIYVVLGSNESRQWKARSSLTLY